MSNWKELLDNEERPKHKKKINKYVFCKKNKITGTYYGKHVYEKNSKTCKLCGHINKQNEPKLETENETENETEIKE